VSASETLGFVFAGESVTYCGYCHIANLTGQLESLSRLR
jgi:hypothetical protein